MGEVVQRRLESMIQEFEDIKRIKLYTDEELKIILKKRKHFENRVNGSTHRDLQDYKDYILFETELLEDVRKRRDMRKVSEKKSTTDYSIINRIKHLYNNAIKFYPNEFEVYESFLLFCKHYNLIPVASKTVDKMLVTLMQFPKIWIIASQWFFSIKKYEKALDILKRGITVHKNCGELYEEIVKTELQQYKINSQKDTEIAQETKIINKLESYLKVLFKFVKNLKPYNEILNVMQEYEFTKNLQLLILDQLNSEHKNEELTWHILAQRELITPTNAPNSEYIPVDQAIAKYEEGLRIVSSKKQLWKFYLDFLIEVYNEYKDKIYKEYLLKAFYNADSSSKTIPNLEIDHYLLWTNIAQDDDISDILKRAVYYYPHSLKIFKKYLKYEIVNDNCKEINNIYEKAKDSLKDIDLSLLWDLYINYHIITSDNVKIKSIFEAEYLNPKLSSKVAPKYLQWLSENEGVPSVRIKYEELLSTFSGVKELHYTMLEIETKSKVINFEESRKIHIFLCNRFGQNDINVWLEYIKFLFKSKVNNFQEIIQQTVTEAEKKLPEDLAIQFLEMYNELIVNL